MQWYTLSDLVAEIKAARQCCCRNVDILHYLDGEHSAQYLPRLFRRLGKGQPKIVATYHQPPEILDAIIRTDVISKLDRVTVVSPEQIPFFKEFIAPDKIQLILHGVDVNYFKPANLAKEAGTFKCITVGYYLRDFKVLQEVAGYLGRHRSIEFHVVSLQEHAVAALPNVTVYRGVDDARLLTLYQQSDILFLPLLQSTANNALLEGIACGLPVVSTCLPSVKAYLPGKEAILIKDNDPKQFVDVILHLANNPSDCRIMGQKARKRAEELDWWAIAPQYEMLYSDLMNNY
jgi:glycosyltransferase involved in cell wall biosynthesis